MGRILIVEDDADLRGSLTEYLAMIGHEPEAAHDGHSALGALRADQARLRSVDLIILDWQLPDGPSGPSGIELLSCLRRITEAPVLVMSGNPASREEAEAGRADAFLAKPFSLADLNRLIASLGQEKRRS